MARCQGKQSKLRATGARTIRSPHELVLPAIGRCSRRTCTVHVAATGRSRDPAPEKRSRDGANRLAGIASEPWCDEGHQEFGFPDPANLHLAVRHLRRISGPATDRIREEVVQVVRV